MTAVTNFESALDPTTTSRILGKHALFSSLYSEQILPLQEFAYKGSFKP
jgi:hypothetical protein